MSNQKKMIQMQKLKLRVKVMQNQMENFKYVAPLMLWINSEKFQKKKGFKTHASALTGLIHAYELANAQAILIDRSTEIENFKTFLNKIQESYLHSLELFASSKEIIKQDYVKLLQEKDNTIQQASEKNNMLMDEVKNYKSNISDLETTINELTKKKDKLEEELEVVKRRELILTDSFSKLNPKTEQLDSAIKDLQVENKQLKTQNKELERDKQELAIRMHNVREENISKAESDFQKLEKSRCEVQDLRQQVYNLKQCYDFYNSKHPEEVQQFQLMQQLKAQSLQPPQTLPQPPQTLPQQPQTPLQLQQALPQQPQALPQPQALLKLQALPPLQ